MTILFSILFISSFLLTSINMGLFLFSKFGSRDISLFLIGTTMTPFILAVANLIVKLAIPFHHVWISPIIISSLNITYFYRNRIFIKSLFINFEFKKRFQTWISSRSYFKFILIPLILLVTSLLLAKIWPQIKFPLIHHDSLIYANEALVFTKNPNYKSLASFYPGAGTLAGHPHSFLYQSYLSFALSFTPTPQLPGFPMDHAMRIAVQFGNLTLLVAIFALCLSFAPLFLAILGPMIFLSFNKVFYIYYAASRDGFRLSSLVIFIFFTHSIFNQKNKENYLISSFFSFLFAIFSIFSHSLNISTLFLVCISLLITLLLSNSKLNFYFKIFWPVGFGSMIGGIHFLLNYWGTGKIFGEGFYYPFYKGTPLWDNLLSSSRYKNVFDKSTFQNLTEIAWSYNIYLFIFLTLVAVKLFFDSFSFWKNNKAYSTSGIFFSTLVFTSFLPMFGIFDFGDIPASKMLAVNYRYLYYLLLFLSLSFIYFLSHCKKVNRSKFIVFTIIIAIYCSFNISQWKTVKEKSIKNFSPLIVEKHFKDSNIKGSILIDKSGSSYYLSNNVYFIYTKFMKSILHAQNSLEVKSILKDKDINYIFLERPLSGWWADTELGKFAVKYKILSDSSYILAKIPMDLKN